MPSDPSNPASCGHLGGPALARALAEAARPHPFKRGDFIAREGDPPDRMGIVLSGRVKIVKHAPNGREVILRVLGPGQAFGVVPVLDRAPYPASVVMLEDGEVGRVDAPRFEAVLRTHPDLALEMMRAFSGRLRKLSQAVGESHTAPVRSRLAARLMDLAGDQRVVVVTRQELADLAGTTVETAIRTTRAWEQDGLVRLARGRIELLDPLALVHEAGVEKGDL